MDKENNDLIKPFKFISPGECPECQTPLVVHDFESETMQLNKLGEPILIKFTSTRCVGKCLKCGTEIPMMNTGMRYVPITKSMISEIAKEVDIPVKRIKNGFLSDNPFAVVND